jgi:hypothetical protein
MVRPLIVEGRARICDRAHNCSPALRFFASPSSNVHTRKNERCFEMDAEDG